MVFYIKQKYSKLTKWKLVSWPLRPLIIPCHVTSSLLPRVIDIFTSVIAYKLAAIFFKSRNNIGVALTCGERRFYEFKLLALLDANGFSFIFLGDF